MVCIQYLQMILTCWANRWWGSELKGTNSHPPTQAANKIPRVWGCDGQIYTVKGHLRTNVSLLGDLPVGLYLASCFICWKAYLWSHGKSESQVLLSSASKAPHHREVTVSRPMRSCFSHHWEVNRGRRELQFHWKKKEKGKNLCFMNVFILDVSNISWQY